MARRDKSQSAKAPTSTTKVEKPAQNPANGGAAASKGKGKGKISDELRQAVKDLGGDDEDLALIADVDDDEDEDESGPSTAPTKSNGKTSEKDLKKALGDFMKGLDFKAAGASMPETEEEADPNEDEGSEDDEEAEDDDVEEDEEEEEEQQEPVHVPVTAGKNSKTAKVDDQPVSNKVQSDPNATSGSIVPSSPNWASLLPTLPPPTTPFAPLATNKLQSLRSRADQLLSNLPPLNRKSTSADAAFISQVLQSGTHQDKLSALVLLVRESPIHAVKELSRLRAMAGYKEDAAGGDSRAGGGGNKDQRLAVCKALVDWWVSGGGKESGKLRYFADQPLLAHPQVSDRHLLVFAFEDFLKKWFFHLLQILEVFSHDPLPYIRTQALQMTFRLLQGNAEQEQNLLRLSANKLGDTDKSVASKTSHLLLTLLQVHPAMKAIVAREVTAMILKPTTPAASSGTHVRFDSKPDPKGKAKADTSEAGIHARYYGLITLNQITLAAGQDQDLAGRLVDVYFEVFREILGESDQMDKLVKEDGADKLENAVGKVDKWEGRRKKAGRGKEGKNGRTDKEEDEGMEGGSARLVAAVLTGINRAMPYAKLDESAFSKYMDTLFRITHLGTFNTSVQSLSLIFQIASAAANSSIKTEITGTSSEGKTLDRFYRTLYDSLFDPRLLSSSKQPMYLNLLFRALKADKEIKRVMAFVKRLCQMFGLASVPFLSGALYLLGELFSVTPGLKRMLIEPEDDEEERFVDAPEEGVVPAKVNGHPTKKQVAEAYDGQKREPLYSRADTSCIWEIIPLTQHYHPSISLLSTQLLLSQPLTGSSDISQNTLISFLDKFVYRNPKKSLAQKGASVMQPAASSQVGTVRLQKGATTGEGDVVNSEAFWKKRIEEVPVDQLFFHKFFSSKLAKKDASSRKPAKTTSEAGDVDAELDEGSEAAASEGEVEGGDDDDDAESVASSLDEDEVWKAMQATMPNAGGDGLDISEDEDLEYSSDDDVDEDDEAVSIGGDPEDDVDVDDVEPEVGDSDAEDDEDEDEDDDDDEGFPDLASEDDDLISLDELDMPDIVLEAEPTPSPEPEAATEDKIGKRKRADERKERKKKRKELPLFGSYDEWQKIIEQGGNEGED